MSDARWRLLIGGHPVGTLTADEVRAILANDTAGRVVSAVSLTGRSEEGTVLDGAGAGRLFTEG